MYDIIMDMFIVVFYDINMTLYYMHMTHMTYISHTYTISI